MDTVHFCLVTVTVLVPLGLHASITSVTERLVKRQTADCSGVQYYLCSSGECLQKYQLCDGDIDCEDKSDESYELCYALYRGRCRSGQWRCRYGGCLDDRKHCDQTRDCWDGSDEEDCPQRAPTMTPAPQSTSEAQPPASCTPRTSRQQGMPCEIPQHNNTQFFTWDKQLVRLSPGSFVPDNELLLVSCEPGHSFSLEERNHKSATCRNGKWTPNIPKCVTCGLSSLTSDSLAADTSVHQAQPGQFPWHAVLYCWKDNAWKVLCAGTLISTRIVLTAAHCVSYASVKVVTPVKIPVDDLRVALGKRHCDWNVEEDTEQRFEVAEVLVHPEATTGLHLTPAHIALVLLDRAVHLMPACLDYTHNYDMVMANDKALFGYLAGWDVTSLGGSGVRQCGPETAYLRHSHLPVISHDDCRLRFGKTKENTDYVFLDDLLCVANGTATHYFLGDNGVGLTVPLDGRHYVSGVYVGKITTASRTYGAFVNASYYMDWILDRVDTWAQDTADSVCPPQS